MINTRNLQQAKNQTKNSTSPIIIKAQDSEFNRKILEFGKFDILLDVHNSSGKDKLKQLDSGFNHVLARIAAKNKIAIGIDLEAIRSISDKKQKAKTFSRIIQNIKLCRKAKCQIKLLNFKDKKDGFDFLISLGASTKQAGEATTF